MANSGLPDNSPPKPDRIIWIELFSGLVSAAGVVVGFVVLGAPAWLCLAGGVGLYLGITYLGSNRVDRRIRREARQLVSGRMRDKLDQDRQKIVQIRELCVNINDEPVRRRILTICGLAEGIFDNLSQNPSPEQAMGRFFLYLERTVRVVEEYSRISADPLGRRLLRDEEKEFLRLLDQAEEAFKTGYKNILHNRIVEFRTMGRVLGRMMEIAEIGK